MLIRMMTKRTANRGIYTATVQCNDRLCDEHYRLTLLVSDFPRSTPGQFVELHTQAAPVDPAHAHLEWEPDGPFPHPRGIEFISPRPFLRRPYSIAAHKTENGASVIDIVYRVIGRMTHQMEALRVNDRISLIGPLGQGFTIPAGTTRVILAGGGVGIPPMLYLASHLAQQHVPTMALIGVQRQSLLPLRVIDPGPSNLPVPQLCIEEFARFGIPAIITTDDGSLGVSGRITSALDFVLSQLAKPGVIVCCCGPTRMMQATAEVSQGYGVTCLASLEQPMACGMGTCQSCIIKYRSSGAADWTYKLTCTDGPVFNTRDIIWN